MPRSIRNRGGVLGGAESTPPALYRMSGSVTEGRVCTRWAMGAHPLADEEKSCPAAVCCFRLRFVFCCRYGHVRAFCPGADAAEAFELRVQIAATRSRVPDVCLPAADHLPKRIAAEPPMFCTEMLFPEDRSSHTRFRCEDYLQMGVPEVWAIDPEQRKAHVLTPDGAMRTHRDGPLRLSGTEIPVDLHEIFRRGIRRVRV